MAELISMTYEQARAEHFKALKDKAERKMNYWAARVYRSRPNDLNDPAHIKASEYGAEYSYYKDALEALENQPKWISVEERLPEEDVTVLGAFLRYNGYEINITKYCVYPHRSVWFIGDMSAVGSTPTHWMPLPEAPKEEK